VSITFLEDGVTLNFFSQAMQDVSTALLQVTPLKHHLSAEHFPNDEAVEREVTAWFRQQPKEFYAAGFQRLVKRWDKCLNVQGDYVEK
jgi:hypothetical protein